MLTYTSQYNQTSPYLPHPLPRTSLLVPQVSLTDPPVSTPSPVTPSGAAPSGNAGATAGSSSTSVEFGELYSTGTEIIGLLYNAFTVDLMILCAHQPCFISNSHTHKTICNHTISSPFTPHHTTPPSFTYITLYTTPPSPYLIHHTFSLLITHTARKIFIRNRKAMVINTNGNAPSLSR